MVFTASFSHEITLTDLPKNCILLAAPLVITEEGLGMTKRRYARVGSATQVSCIVQGFPIPTVRWWLDERL